MRGGTDGSGCDGELREAWELNAAWGRHVRNRIG